MMEPEVLELELVQWVYDRIGIEVFLQLGTVSTVHARGKRCNVRGDSMKQYDAENDLGEHAGLFERM